MEGIVCGIISTRVDITVIVLLIVVHAQRGNLFIADRTAILFEQGGARFDAVGSWSIE